MSSYHPSWWRRSHHHHPTLPHAQHGPTEPSERHRLSFQSLDFSLHRRRHHGVGSSPAKLSELLFEVLFRLRRDISPSLFLLECGYEPAWLWLWGRSRVAAGLFARIIGIREGLRTRPEWNEPS